MVAALRLGSAILMAEDSVAIVGNVAAINITVAHPIGNNPIPPVGEGSGMRGLTGCFLSMTHQQLVGANSLLAVMGNVAKIQLFVQSFPMASAQAPPDPAFWNNIPFYSLHFSLVDQIFETARYTSIGAVISIDRNTFDARIISFNVTNLLNETRPLIVSLIGTHRGQIRAADSLVAIGCPSVNAVDLPDLGLSNYINSVILGALATDLYGKLTRSHLQCGNSAIVLINSVAPPNSKVLLAQDIFSITASIVASVPERKSSGLSSIFQSIGEGAKLLIVGNSLKLMVANTNRSQIQTTLNQSLPLVSSIGLADITQASMQEPPIPSVMAVVATNATTISSSLGGSIAFSKNVVEVVRAALVSSRDNVHVWVPLSWNTRDEPARSNMSISVFRSIGRVVPQLDDKGFEVTSFGTLLMQNNVIRLVAGITATDLSSMTTPLPLPSTRYPLFALMSFLDTEKFSIKTPLTSKDSIEAGSFALIELSGNRFEVPFLPLNFGYQPLTIGGAYPSYPMTPIAFTPTTLNGLPPNMVVGHFTAWRSTTSFPTLNHYLTVSLCDNAISDRFISASEVMSFPFLTSQLASVLSTYIGLNNLQAAMFTGKLHPSALNPSRPSPNNITVLGCPLPVTPPTNLAAIKGAEVIVGSVGIISVASGQVTAMNAMLRLAKCDGEINSGGSGTLGDELADDVSMGLAAHPLRFAIGTGTMAIYRGAAVSNTIVFPLLVALIVRFGLGPAVRFWATQDRSLETALRTVGWPSAIFLPYVSLAEGTGKAIAVLFRSNAAEDIAIGSLVSIVLLSVIACWFCILLKVIPGRLIFLSKALSEVDEEHINPLLDGGDNKYTSAPSKLHVCKRFVLSPSWWLSPRMEWTPNVQVGHVSIGFMGRAELPVEMATRRRPLSRATTSSTALDEPNDPFLRNDSDQTTEEDLQASMVGSSLSLDITGSLSKTNIEFRIESFAHIIGDRRFLIAEMVVFVCTLCVGIVEGLPSHWCRVRIMLAFSAIVVQILCDIINLIPIVWATQMMMNIAVFGLSAVAIQQVFEGGEASADTENALEELGTLGNALGMISIVLSLASTLYRSRRMYKRSVRQKAENVSLRDNIMNLQNTSFAMHGFSRENLSMFPLGTVFEGTVLKGSESPTSEDKVEDTYIAPSAKSKSTSFVDSFVGVIRLGSQKPQARSHPISNMAYVPTNDTFTETVLQNVESTTDAFYNRRRE